MRKGKDQERIHVLSPVARNSLTDKKFANYLKHKCQDDDCPRYHSPPCHFWSQGTCNKGYECLFYHASQPAAAAQKNVAADEDTPNVTTPEGRQGSPKPRKKKGAVCVRVTRSPRTDATRGNSRKQAVPALYKSNLCGPITAILGTKSNLSAQP